MKLIHPKSLAVTLDAVNEAFFCGQPIAKSEKLKLANWIADRQGQPGAYAGMFAPTDLDIKSGFKVFTGEPVRSGAATSHILGEEACRALILLEVKTPAVKKALELATAGIEERVLDSVARGYQVGTYCCGICTDSFWRHLSVGGIKNINPEKWLVAGMKSLNSLRRGDGEWRRYPFFYTLLALNEIDLPSAVAELKYAAPVCERYLKRANRKDIPAFAGMTSFPRRREYAQRRRRLIERILEKC